MSTDADPSSNHPTLIIVMGVSGCGKSTLTTALAASLGLPSVDADDLHPPANVAKMSAGHPLTDADRDPWLELVRTTAEHICAEQDADTQFAGRKGVIVACSALKRRYRDVLRGTAKPCAVPPHLDPPHPDHLPTYVVFMKGERATLVDRMSRREGHFMKLRMLDSQLETLESPEGEDGVVVVHVEDPTEQQVAAARGQLEKLAGSL